MDVQVAHAVLLEFIVGVHRVVVASAMGRGKAAVARVQTTGIDDVLFPESSIAW